MAFPSHLERIVCVTMHCNKDSGIIGVSMLVTTPDYNEDSHT